MTFPSFFKFFLLLLVFVNIISHVESAKKIYQARKSDVKFIKCEVCELLAKNLLNLVKQKQKELAPKKKLSELEIIELTEKICEVKRREGDWIMKQDIVEKGDKLTLDEQDDIGECRTECKTVQKACEEIVGESDTDIAEFIYSADPNRSQLTNKLCRGISNACLKKPPPVPKDRPRGEAFVRGDRERLEMEKKLQEMNVKPQVFHDVSDEDMAKMKNMPKMKMYSRDELEKQTFKGMKSPGGDDDEDEEEEEEEGSDEDKIQDLLKKTNKDLGDKDLSRLAADIKESAMAKVKELDEEEKKKSTVVGRAKKTVKAAADWVLGKKENSDDKEL